MSKWVHEIVVSRIILIIIIIIIFNYISWCLTQPNIIYTFRCWLLIFPSHQHIKMIKLRFLSFQFSVKFPRSHVSESSSSSGSRCGLRFVGNKKWSRWSDQFYVYVDIVVDVELDVNVDVVSQRMFEKSHLFQGCVGVTAVLNRGGNQHLYPVEKTLISFTYC